MRSFPPRRTKYVRKHGFNAAFKSRGKLNPLWSGVVHALSGWGIQWTKRLLSRVRGIWTVCHWHTVTGEMALTKSTSTGLSDSNYRLPVHSRSALSTERRRHHRRRWWWRCAWSQHGARKELSYWRARTVLNPLLWKFIEYFRLLVEEFVQTGVFRPREEESRISTTPMPGDFGKRLGNTVLSNHKRVGDTSTTSTCSIICDCHWLVGPQYLDLWY